MTGYSKIYLSSLTWILLVLSPAQDSFAQKAYPTEKIHIGTDRDLYIVGEEINFKLYTLDANSLRPVQYSDIVYMELLDRQNSPMIREKFKITGGEAYGKLIIPSEMTSDFYVLRAYTNWMKNVGAEGYAYRLISVVNPFEEIRPGIILKKGMREIDSLVRPEGKTISNKGQGMIIKAKTDQAFYKTRQKVTLDLEIVNPDGTPAEANLVLSLAREGLLDEAVEHQRGDNFRQQEISEPGFPPEWGGHIVSGNVSEKPGGKPRIGDTLLFSIVGKSAVFDYAVSDSNGNFRFLVKNVKGLHEIVIQHVNPLVTNYLIRLDDPFSENFMDIPFPDFYLDTSMALQINQAVINAQINVLYEDEMIPPGQEKVPLSFYGRPEFSLRLDDYLRLPEMHEVFFELIPFAQMRGKGKETSIRLRNNDGLLFSESSPLLLIDGVVVHDASLIAGLDARKVERIDLVNRDYYFGLIHFRGILNVVTTEGKCPITHPEPVFRQSYEFTASSEPYPFPSYDEEHQVRSSLPDFRNTLYWDPGIRTDKNGRAKVTFYTGDDAADYILKIEGFTSDGQIVSYGTSFSVRKH